MIIYKISNNFNKKIYIGQTTAPLWRRWSAHCCDTNNSLIHKAIKKYGKENFKIEEIAGANNESELNYLEKHYIYINNSVSPNGYNLASGGKDFKHCDESNIKNRKSKLGTKLTEEIKLKMSESHKKRFTPELRLEYSKRLSGSNHPMFGKKHSEEAKIKMSGKRGKYKKYPKLSEDRKKELVDRLRSFPPGMLGKKHSEKTKLKIKQKLKEIREKKKELCHTQKT